jgi:4-amino-4-deoxy-L-arabinose transferase-like glycosyltransferase
VCDGGVVATLKLREQREGSHGGGIVAGPRADKQQVTTIPLPLAIADHSDARPNARVVAGRWLLIGFCLIAALVGRLSYLSQPFDDDGAMFVYLGRVVTEGGRFCHDVVDNKFPTVGLITSPVYRAFGNRWGGYVLLQTALGVGGAMLLARSAARQFGESARLPALCFALVHFNLYVAVYGGFQLETMQCFFAILAAGAAMELLGGTGDWRDGFVVGLAAGCAAMLKPTGGAVLAAFAIATIVTSFRRPFKVIAHGVASACGLAIPALVVLAYLVGTNVLHDMPTLYRQIARYAAETPFEPVDLLKPLTVIVIIGFPMYVRGWIGRRDCTGVKPASPLMIFILAWLALEFAGALAQRRMYPYHFLPLAPPAALLFASIPRQERLTRIAAAVAPAAMASIVFGLLLVARMDGKPARTAASEYLIAHASPAIASGRTGTAARCSRRICGPARACR